MSACLARYAHATRQGSSVLEALGMVALMVLVLSAGTEALTQLHRWQQAPDGGSLDRACDRLRADARGTDIQDKKPGSTFGDITTASDPGNQSASIPLTTMTLHGVPWSVREGRLWRGDDSLCQLAELHLERNGTRIALALHATGLPDHRIVIAMPVETPHVP